jgi:hypothetical protein
MDNKEHGSILMLLGKPKEGEPGKEGAEAADSDDMEMKKSAMDDFISAIHAKDSSAALSAYSDLCQMHEESESADEAKAEGE